MSTVPMGNEHFQHKDSDGDFVTARAAAEMLGTTEAEIISKLQERRSGLGIVLQGGELNGEWYVLQHTLAREKYHQDVALESAQNHAIRKEVEAKQARYILKRLAPIYELIANSTYDEPELQEACLSDGIFLLGELQRYLAKEAGEVAV